jgi:SAM domain (Sterile alpha motif)
LNKILFLGLDDTIYPYSHYFINNNVTGRGLLNVTVDDLYKLHVEKLGHQEIILEGLEHLRNLVSSYLKYWVILCIHPY